MKNFLLLSLLLVLLSTACKEKNVQVQKFKDEVIAVHDVAMAKMDRIHSLKKQLKKSLETSNDSTLIFDKLGNLSDADEAMMLWMENFSAFSDQKDDATKMKFLTEEMAKIQEVNKKMDTAISDVEQYLGK